MMMYTTKKRESLLSLSFSHFFCRKMNMKKTNFMLLTDKPLPVDGLVMIERSIYGICVPYSEVSNIREIA